MRYEHYSEVNMDDWRWPNFNFDTDERLACPCCGEFYLDKAAMDAIQKSRDILNAPMNLNSGHRCEKHNSKVSKATKSQHLKLAFDIRIDDHDPRELLLALMNGGFGSFGFYGTFIHADLRTGRRWYGEGGREKWEDILNYEVII